LKLKTWENKYSLLKKNRQIPRVDRKIITSWNAQMILGLLSSFEAFGDEQFLIQAKKTFLFLKENLISGGKLMHTFQDNQSKIEANLEDYAFTIRAALGLYQNTGNVNYLEQSNKLTKEVIKNFETNENPFFTFTKYPVMFSEIISIDDNVIPSANSIMAENLWILGIILENEKYSEKANEMLDVVSTYFCEGKGSNYTQWAQLISKVAYSYKEVVIVGPDAYTFNKELQKNYLPNVIFQISNQPTDLPLLEDRYIKDQTIVYVCKDKVCLRPSETPSEALKQINDF